MSSESAGSHLPLVTGWLEIPLKWHNLNAAQCLTSLPPRG